jgi:hypothetical protein
MFGSRRKFKPLFIVLLLVIGGAWLISPRSHWLMSHGRATCDGQPVIGATVYRSVQGDIFLDWPNYKNEGMPAVSAEERILLRCNSPAFKHVFGLLWSREAVPSSQCGLMWKGAGTGDVIPPHIVTETYAQFPWGSCSNLKVDY